MASPTSPVDICNLALDALGERANVTSIANPELPSEVILARHYDLTREALLEEYVWNFARTEATLARTGDGGEDYVDKFLVPADFLRLISIGTRDFEIRDYNIQGRELFVNPVVPPATSSNALFIRYVKNATDVSQMSSLFKKLLALQLALDVSYKFKNKKTQVELIAKMLQMELPKATSVNSQQKKPTRRDISSTIIARQFDLVEVIHPNQVFWLDV